jgi:transposase
MPAASSRDLRERLLRARDAGLSSAEIERTTGVSVRSLARWRAQRDQGQSLAPKHSPGPPRRLSPEQERLLTDQVAATPDATVQEHRDRLEAEHGLVVSRATTGRILQRHRLTLKKRP